MDLNSRSPGRSGPCEVRTLPRVIYREDAYCRFANPILAKKLDLPLSPIPMNRRGPNGAASPSSFNPNPFPLRRLIFVCKYFMSPGGGSGGVGWGVIVP